MIALSTISIIVIDTVSAASASFATAPNASPDRSSGADYHAEHLPDPAAGEAVGGGAEGQPAEIGLTPGLMVLMFGMVHSASAQGSAARFRPIGNMVNPKPMLQSVTVSPPMR
jgi:hypothetical protein